MTKATKSQLIREATEIFLRLRDAPDDDDLKRAREQFLERGQPERDAYAKMLEAWRATETGPQSRAVTLPTIIAAMILIAGAFWWAEPARVVLLADHSSALAPKTLNLASGDRVTLDADTAIIDETKDALREITLMQGAAFFDVTPGERPFIVTSNALEVRVLGTSFEVAELGRTSLVAVSEGSVEVSDGRQTWQLEAGEQLSWSEDGGANLSLAGNQPAASWREGLLVTDGLNLAEVAAIIDRRLPGRVLIADAGLGQTPIVGTFDLSDPLLSLKTLASLEGARVISIPSLVTILVP